MRRRRDVAAAADAVARLDRDRALLRRLSDAARASQTRIRSHEGALDAWAEAFEFALDAPQRRGSALPRAPRDRGRLAALPDALTEPVRRARRIVHADAGDEWPHWSGNADEALFEELRRFGGR
ncbi:MAG: hypothetical protein DMF56_18255 [Acidobacteria bacterium]|nr:MAG: hypothetical protein DMF56_18255 [Acidobacteriota bacterium]